MMGFGALGEFALGQVEATLSILTFEPVSRILAGGASNSRPPEVAVLGVDLIWDNESIMVWDDDTVIGWES